MKYKANERIELKRMEETHTEIEYELPCPGELIKQEQLSDSDTSMNEDNEDELNEVVSLMVPTHPDADETKEEADDEIQVITNTANSSKTTQIFSSPEDTREHQCLQCPALLKDFDKLVNHMGHHHVLDHQNQPNYPIVTNCFQLNGSSHAPKLFSCSLCKATFPQNEALIFHMMGHEDFRPAQTTETKLTIAKHFSCSMCKASFSQNDALITHMMTHDDLRPFKCAECNRSFVNGQSLRVHSTKAHSKRIVAETVLNKREPITILTCKHCSKSFSNSQMLKIHETTAHGEKDGGESLDKVPECDTTMEEKNAFKCTTCNKSFASSREVRGHTAGQCEYMCGGWTSKEIRPFICKVCNRSFVNLRDMRVHETKTHLKSYYYLRNGSAYADAESNELANTEEAKSVNEKKSQIKISNLGGSKYVCGLTGQDGSTHMNSMANERLSTRGEFAGSSVSSSSCTNNSFANSVDSSDSATNRCGDDEVLQQSEITRGKGCQGRIIAENLRSSENQNGQLGDVTSKRVTNTNITRSEGKEMKEVLVGDGNLTTLPSESVQNSVKKIQMNASHFDQNSKKDQDLRNKEMSEDQHLRNKEMSVVGNASNNGYYTDSRNTNIEWTNSSNATGRDLSSYPRLLGKNNMISGVNIPNTWIAPNRADNLSAQPTNILNTIPGNISIPCCNLSNSGNVNAVRGIVNTAATYRPALLNGAYTSGQIPTYQHMARDGLFQDSNNSKCNNYSNMHCLKRTADGRSLYMVEMNGSPEYHYGNSLAAGFPPLTENTLPGRGAFVNIPCNSALMTPRHILRNPVPTVMNHANFPISGANFGTNMNVANGDYFARNDSQVPILHRSNNVVYFLGDRIFKNNADIDRNSVAANVTNLPHESHVSNGTQWIGCNPMWDMRDVRRTNEGSAPTRRTDNFNAVDTNCKSGLIMANPLVAGTDEVTAPSSNFALVSSSNGSTLGNVSREDGAFNSANAENCFVNSGQYSTNNLQTRKLPVVVNPILENADINCASNVHNSSESENMIVREPVFIKSTILPCNGGIRNKCYYPGYSRYVNANNNSNNMFLTRSVFPTDRSFVNVHNVSNSGIPLNVTNGFQNNVLRNTYGIPRDENSTIIHVPDTRRVVSNPYQRKLNTMYSPYNPVVYGMNNFLQNSTLLSGNTSNNAFMDNARIPSENIMNTMKVQQYHGLSDVCTENKNVPGNSTEAENKNYLRRKTNGSSVNLSEHPKTKLRRTEKMKSEKRFTGEVSEKTSVFSNGKACQRVDEIIPSKSNSQCEQSFMSRTIQKSITDEKESEVISRVEVPITTMMDKRCRIDEKENINCSENVKTKLCSPMRQKDSNIRNVLHENEPNIPGSHFGLTIREISANNETSLLQNRCRTNDSALNGEMMLERNKLSENIMCSNTPNFQQQSGTLTDKSEIIQQKFSLQTNEDIGRQIPLENERNGMNKNENNSVGQDHLPTLEVKINSEALGHKSSTPHISGNERQWLSDIETNDISTNIDGNKMNLIESNNKHSKNESVKETKGEENNTSCNKEFIDISNLKDDDTPLDVSKVRNSIVSVTKTSSPNKRQIEKSNGTLNYDVVWSAPYFPVKRKYCKRNLKTSENMSCAESHSSLSQQQSSCRKNDYLKEVQLNDLSGDKYFSAKPSMPSDESMVNGQRIIYNMSSETNIDSIDTNRFRNHTDSLGNCATPGICSTSSLHENNNSFTNSTIDCTLTKSGIVVGKMTLGNNEVEFDQNGIIREHFKNQKHYVNSLKAHSISNQSLCSETRNDSQCRQSLESLVSIAKDSFRAFSSSMINERELDPTNKEVVQKGEQSCTEKVTPQLDQIFGHSVENCDEDKTVETRSKSDTESTSMSVENQKNLTNSSNVVFDSANYMCTNSVANTSSNTFTTSMSEIHKMPSNTKINSVSRNVISTLSRNSNILNMEGIPMADVVIENKSGQNVITSVVEVKSFHGKVSSTNSSASSQIVETTKHLTVNRQTSNVLSKAPSKRYSCDSEFATEAMMLAHKDSQHFGVKCKCARCFSYDSNDRGNIETANRPFHCDDSLSKFLKSRISNSPQKVHETIQID